MMVYVSVLLGGLVTSVRQVSATTIPPMLEQSHINSALLKKQSHNSPTSLQTTIHYKLK